MMMVEERNKMTAETWDENNIQWKRLKSWFYSVQGVDIKPFNEDPFVIRVEQYSLKDRGCIYTQKDLIEKARQLYPDKRYKIRALTFSLQVEDVTPEWIQEQMKLYGVKTKDLVHQIALSPASVSLLINGTRPMGNHTKALIFYYFLSLKLARIAYMDITAEELQEALEHIREKRNQE